MSESPLMCWRWRDGKPAPVPIADISEDFTGGAILIEWSGSSRIDDPRSSYVEWSNGAAEFSFITKDCADGEAVGIWLARCTCLTAIDRLYEVARRQGMAITGDVTYVADADLAKHYEDDRADASVVVVPSFEEFVEAMPMIWRNCPPEAASVA